MLGIIEWKKGFMSFEVYKHKMNLEPHDFEDISIWPLSLLKTIICKDPTKLEVMLTIFFLISCNIIADYERKNMVYLFFRLLNRL